MLKRKYKYNTFFTGNELNALFDDLVYENKLVRDKRTWVLLKPIVYEIRFNQFKELEGVIYQIDGEPVVFNAYNKVDAKEEFMLYIQKVIWDKISDKLGR